LDDLNSALDILEEKNDNITVQLLELLQNSREVRKTLADEREQAQSNE
jgi:vacuolar-type H+-ATPase subunit D/Vma8